MRHASGEPPENVGDRDAHTANARPPPALAWFDRHDPLVVHVSLRFPGGHVSTARSRPACRDDAMIARCGRRLRAVTGSLQKRERASARRATGAWDAAR